MQKGARSGSDGVLPIPPAHPARRPLCILIVAAWVFLSMLAVSPGARAFTTVRFTTTADWNSGVKANVSTISDRCENVTSNALQLNNTGNYVGIGLTTGTSTCATGAWGVSSSGLVLAYDMQTLNAGTLRDFSGSGVVATSANNPYGPIPEKLGKGYQFNYSKTMFAGSTFFLGTTIPQSSTLSVFAWVFPFGNLTVGGDGARGGMILSHISRGGSSLRDWYFVILPNGSAQFTTANTVGAEASAVSPPSIVPGYWYALVGTRNASLNRIYINGTLRGSNPNGAATFSPMTGVYYCMASFDACGDSYSNKKIDEAAIFNRVLTQTEITALSADGRSSFFSSGTWTSPVQSGTPPVSAEIDFASQTSSNHVSRVQILSGTSGTVVWDSGAIGYFATSPLKLDIVNITQQPATWKVKVSMIGSGTSVSQLTGLVLTIGFPPTLDANAMLFILFLVLFLVFSLAGLVMEIYGLTVIGGIIGILFGLWFLGLTSANVTLGAVIASVGAFFAIIGGIFAMSGGGD